jgi:two-component system, NtrC family, sensor histidine kinase HydH
MPRRPLIFVSVTLIVALTVLVWIGLRVLERDRADLFDRYGETRAHVLEEAARSVSAEATDVGEDLDLASTLLESGDSTQIVERELHAIATIKREYLMMYARTPGGAVTTKVTAFDAPPGVADKAGATLEKLLQLAVEQPGRLHSSTAFAPPSDAAGWYRVFSHRGISNGLAVAVAVDVAVLLRRMKLQRDANTRVLVVDDAGNVAPSSDAVFNEVVGTQTPLDAFIEAARRTGGARGLVSGDVARRLGLSNTDAVVAGVTFVLDGGAPWTMLMVTSTVILQTQQRTIVRRVLVGSGLVLVLLLSAAAYVVHNAYRARTLRERLKHTDRLAQLTEKAERMLDHIPSGVLALSDDLHVTGVNRWLAERIGHDVVGRALESTFEAGRAEDVARVVALVKRALDEQEPRALLGEQVALLGQEASLNIHAVPLARGVGDVSVLLVFEDLTELRRIEQRLLHSEKLVTAGQLAAGIAHEIGTPLNVARGRVELSLSHLGNQHAEADNHRLVIDQIDRVTRLIQQLLDYVRPAPTSVREIDLAQSLHAVRDLLAPQAAKRNVSLGIDVSPEASTLRTDPDQVQQILVNLALNAIDACEKGGTVALRARRRDDAIVLEIEDTGHGIPRELQKQVFDPFFTTKKRGQGTGLGLWVVAQLVRAQAAEIELDSAPGQGTTVRIAWPVLS